MELRVGLVFFIWKIIKKLFFNINISKLLKNIKKIKKTLKNFRSAV